MTTAIRVGAYLVVLAGVFASAVGIGNAVGPIGQPADRTRPPPQTEVGHDEPHMGGPTSHQERAPTARTARPDGAPRASTVCITTRFPRRTDELRNEQHNAGASRR